MLDDEHQIVEKMVEFLYTATYSTSKSDASLVRSVKLYIMGDKYDIANLKSFASNEFESLMKKTWSVDDFTAALYLIYTQLPDSDAALKDTALTNLCAGTRFQKVVDSRAFKEICEEIGQVG